MRLVRLLRSLSWGRFFFYGEAIGLLAAWALGLTIALDREPAVEPSRTADSLAVVSGGQGQVLPLE